MNKIKPKSFDEEMASPERKMFPNFYINLEYLPEAKEWEPGETYQIGLKVKMTGINIRESEDKESGDVNFDIIGIEVQKVKADSAKKIKRYT